MRNNFFLLSAPEKGEGKQDYLKRCMDGDESKIATCAAKWNAARLSSFVDENEVRLSSDVWLDPLSGGDDAKGPRRFSVLAHTGKEIDFGWYGRFIIDLTGIRMAKDKIPALIDHERDKRLGVIDTSKQDKNGFFVMGAFLTSETAQALVRDMDEGFPMQASIGVRGLRILQIKKGETTKVNGRTVEGPLDVWLESEVFETSFVTFGADDDTAAVAMTADRADTNKPEDDTVKMTAKLRALLVKLGLPTDADDAAAFAFLEGLDETTLSEPLTGVDKAESDKLRMQMLEAKLMLAELKLSGAHGHGYSAPQPAPQPPASVTLSGADVLELQGLGRRIGLGQEEIDKALSAPGVNKETARLALLETLAAQNPPLGTRVEMGTDERDKLRMSMTDGVLMRMGMAMEKPAAGHERFRALTLHELAAFCLERSGVKTAGMTKLQKAENIVRLSALGASSSDFSAVFMEAAHRTLLRAYAEAPDTYSAWTNIVPANDFRDIYGIALSEAPDLELVEENGEYKTGEFKDNQENYRVGKYGKIVSLTLEMIVNDDLRAFQRLPQVMGSAARRKVADVVYGLLTGSTTMSDGKALFHSDHKNLEATSKGLVTSDTLSAARKAMRKQTGMNGGKLDIRPRYLLVPVAQETSVDIILRSASLPTASMSAGVYNPFGGKFEPISEPRLDDVSEKAWYLVGDPSQIDTIELSFLDGPEPTLIENDEFVRDAVSYKVRHIFGGGAMDFRGVYKNPGE